MPLINALLGATGGAGAWGVSVIVETRIKDLELIV
jgi:hypothetical protein